MAAICQPAVSSKSTSSVFWTGMDDSSDDPDSVVPGVTANGNLRPRPRGRKTLEVKARVPRKQQLVVQEARPQKEMLVHELSQSLDESRPKAKSGKITLKDLCPADKQRVANLIKELAKVGEEKDAAMQQLQSQRQQHERQVTQLVEQQERILSEREELQSKLFNCLELLTQFQCQVLQQQQQQQAMEQEVEERSEELRRQSAPVQDNRNNNNATSQVPESQTEVRGHSGPQSSRRSCQADGGEWMEQRQRGEGQPSYPPPSLQPVYPPPPSQNWQQLSQSYTAQIDQEIAQKRHHRGHDPSPSNPDPGGQNQEADLRQKSSKRPSYPRRVPVPGALREPIMSSTQKSVEFNTLLSYESTHPSSAEFRPLSPDSSPQSVNSERFSRLPTGPPVTQQPGELHPHPRHGKLQAEASNRNSCEDWVSRPYEEEGRRSRREEVKEADYYTRGSQGKRSRRGEEVPRNQGSQGQHGRQKGGNSGKGGSEGASAESRVGFSDPPGEEMTPGRRSSPPTQQSPLLGDRQFMDYYKKLSPTERKQELLRQRAALLQEQEKLREVLVKQEHFLKEKQQMIMKQHHASSHDSEKPDVKGSTKYGKDQQNHRSQRRSVRAQGNGQARHSRSPPLLMVAKRLDYSLQSDSESGAMPTRKSPPLLVAAKPLVDSPSSISGSERSFRQRSRVSAATSPFLQERRGVTSVGTSPLPLPPHTPSPPHVDAGTSVSYHTLRRSPRGDNGHRLYSYSPPQRDRVASPEVLSPVRSPASDPGRNKSLSLTEIVQTLDNAPGDLDLDLDEGFSTPPPFLRHQVTSDLSPDLAFDPRQHMRRGNLPGGLNIAPQADSDDDNNVHEDKADEDAEFVASDGREDEEEDDVMMMMMMKTPSQPLLSAARTAYGTEGFIPHDDSDADDKRDVEEEDDDKGDDNEESKILEEVFFLK